MVRDMKQTVAEFFMPKNAVITAINFRSPAPNSLNRKNMNKILIDKAKISINLGPFKNVPVIIQNPNHIFGILLNFRSNILDTPNSIAVYTNIKSSFFSMLIKLTRLKIFDFLH